jgi:hypothetical protein
MLERIRAEIGNFFDWGKVEASSSSVASSDSRPNCPYRNFTHDGQQICAVYQKRRLYGGPCNYPSASLEDCPGMDYGQRSPDLCEVEGIDKFPAINTEDSFINEE